MKKFFIIDHSLSNLQGHHYECSVSIAEAAARQGYQPIIVANHSFPKELYHPSIKMLSVFEVDWFNNPVNIQKLQGWKLYLQKFLEILNDKPLETFYQKIESTLKFYLTYWNLTQPKLRLFLEKVQGSTSRLWDLINKDIKLLQSIPLSNSLWGIGKLIWGLFRFIIDIISTKINRKLITLLTHKPASFQESLSKTLKDLNVNPDDHVFIHTIGIEQVEEVYFFLRKNNASSLPQFHILLRRDIKDPLVVYTKGMGLKKLLQQFVESKLWPDKIQFYTDTEDLVQRYNTLSAVIFDQIPIPFRQEKLKSIPKNKSSSIPINIVYLGDARPEKGYHHLPKIVNALWKDYIKPGKLRFIIQSNFNIEGGLGNIRTAKLQLERYPNQKVSLIKEAMSPDDYYQLLGKADILILPYDPDSYRVRTSGVLTEALAAGKPVVVPTNSWLAKQVDLSRACIYKTLDEIPERIISIVENLPKFTAAAKQFSLEWKEKNSPDYLVKFLLSRKNITIQNLSSISQAVKVKLSPQKNINSEILKVLLLIESDCLLEQNNKKDFILKQIEYLSRCGYKIYGIFFPSSKTIKQENFDSFRSKLNRVITNLNQDFFLTQSCIINYRTPNSLPQGISARKYTQDLCKDKTSLERALVERYNLEIHSLLETNQFDLTFINSIASWSIIERYSLDQAPIICEVSDILSYQYASKNDRNIDLAEYQLECQLLNKCSGLIFHHDYELEKIKEKVKNPQSYLLSFDKTQEFKQLSNNKYYSLMDEILSSLLKKRALSIKESNKKVAILYPWGDILERKSGASKRVGLLIDYLKSELYQVWLLTTGERKDFRRDNIRYTYYQESQTNYSLVKDIYADAYRTCSKALNLSLADNKEQKVTDEWNHWLPWIYYQYRFDSGFISQIENIVEWADVIILEYPFWSLTVTNICRQYQTKLIITAHDILSKQLDSSTLPGKIALAEEIEGLKQADHLICVSQNDRDFLKKYKLDAQVIPNPVDLDSDKFIDHQEEIFKILDKKCLELLTQPFCLFVGSQHPPNIGAVEKIRQISQSFAQEYPRVNCNFVVVGSCWKPEHQDNFLSLGKVENQVLSFLYQKASLIIAPIMSGTGTSLKIMEGMAYGKVILGTTIAFRGYPVKSQQEAIICDCLTDYPLQIAALLHNKQKQQEIGYNAKKLAQDYDYRHLYSLYKELIEL
ncbi:glycosyltransferase [cyanobacterium endosymbiont of Epithemia clementina EcSB]|uniref:glycosyltransferase n=1 Tax=cyanobacterium endosymbiont of Epithemia clementina EcSB TaxID=3034674 RepID=UPI002481591D|nr:glycosyltransferase [cyanobacterium endosymbiont of Epithemia clementina EcSB]WGT68322.1 glycosyltransferase [cyanobacterium endosymbiont of Epithemia clementina EcSB]